MASRTGSSRTPNVLTSSASEGIGLSAATSSRLQSLSDPFDHPVSVHPELHSNLFRCHGSGCAIYKSSHVRAPDKRVASKAYRWQHVAVDNTEGAVRRTAKLFGHLRGIQWPEPNVSTAPLMSDHSSVESSGSSSHQADSNRQATDRPESAYSSSLTTDVHIFPGMNHFKRVQFVTLRHIQAPRTGA
jgi:hypothetical protein